MAHDVTHAVVALGEQSLVEGYPLAGARAVVAESDEDVRREWAALPDDVGVVLLTPRAARALADELADPGRPMTAVLPS